MSFFLIILTARSGSIRVDNRPSIAEDNISNREEAEEQAESDPIVNTMKMEKLLRSPNSKVCHYVLGHHLSYLLQLALTPASLNIKTE